MVPRFSDPRVTAMARAGSDFGRQTRPLIGGTPHRRARDCLTVVEVWSCVPDGCFVPGRTGRLTIGRYLRLDSTSSCLRDNEYELKNWRDCWGRCFVLDPLRMYASRDSRLALQGSNHLHRRRASRKRRRKGNPVPGGITGPPCSWGFKEADLASRLGEFGI
jgi:hypothetical protein